MQLDGQVALVTGAGAGIGRATAADHITGAEARIDGGESLLDG